METDSRGNLGMTYINREAVESMAKRVAEWGCGNGSEECPEMLLALRDRLDELQAERDSYRAVLDGAEYRDIDGIGKAPVEQCRALGELAKERTLKIKERGYQQGLDAALIVMDGLCKKYAEATYQTKAGREQNAAKCYLAGEAYELIRALKPHTLESAKAHAAEQENEK